MTRTQHLYGLSPLRRTAEEVSFNIAYCWLLGYRLQEDTPYFSTISDQITVSRDGRVQAVLKI